MELTIHTAIYLLLTNQTNIETDFSRKTQRSRLRLSFFLNFPAGFHPSLRKFLASLEDLKRKFPFRL